ncbi:hypothetical protein [uncultured Ramlibacter sp.]|uniref:hypothetical protein n=1 Tax=uncultured Ramlibacter sp. TaxID=260755 RepID=UPI002619BEC6|nr:hypothetical protein [uncultured Ramlibacter sp.]
MRKTSYLLASLAAAGMLSLTGCDVQKTQEGSVTAPKYEVSKTKEGDVTLPKYNVDAPDVKVSKVEKEVTVPKITTEKETIALPKVEITPAPDKDDGPKK